MRLISPLASFALTIQASCYPSSCIQNVPSCNSYRPYPQTCNCEITSFTSGWQITKGGKGALFYSQIAVNDGKRQRVE